MKYTNQHILLSCWVSAGVQVRQEVSNLKEGLSGYSVLSAYM